MLRRALVIAVVSSLLISAAASDAPAQERSDRRLAVTAGTLTYDASGTGNTYILAARASRPVARRWLGLELGLAYAPLDEQFTSAPTHLAVFDAQLQLQLPAARVQPYVGVGPGLVSYLTEANGRSLFELGLSGALGTRIQLTRRVGAVVDGRVRGWRIAGTSIWPVNAGAELTAGLSYPF